MADQLSGKELDALLRKISDRQKTSKGLPVYGSVHTHMKNIGQPLPAKEYDRQAAQSCHRMGLGNTALFSNLTDPKAVKLLNLQNLPSRGGNRPVAPPPSSTLTGPPAKSDFTGPWTVEHFKGKVEKLRGPTNRNGKLDIDYAFVISYAKQKGVDLDLIYAIGRLENTWKRNSSNNMGNIKGNTTRNRDRFNKDGFCIFDNETDGLLGLIDFLTLPTPNMYPRTLKEVLARGGLWKWNSDNTRRLIYCEGDSISSTPGSYSGNIPGYCRLFREPL